MDDFLKNELKQFLKDYYYSITGEQVTNGKKFLCLSKEHSDTVPSMVYYENPTPKFVCMGCGKSFDIFDTARELEGLQLNQAISMLSIKYGLEDRLYQNTIKPSEIKAILKDIMNIALSFKEELIAQNVKQYLEQKNITTSDMLKYNIGYIRNGTKVLDMMLKKYPKELLKEIGLLSFRNGEHTFIGKDFLIFGIKDQNNDFVSIASRYCSNDEKFPKYTNLKTSNKDFYNKTDFPYGIDIAKKSENKNELIIVEGYSDAITLYKNNFENCIALSGLTFKKETFEAIKNIGYDSIVLNLDSDKAGNNGVFKIVDFCNTNGYKLNIKVKLFDDPIDPDEYIIKYGIKKYTSLPLISEIKFVTKFFLTSMQGYELSKKIGEYLYVKKTFPITSTVDDIYDVFKSSEILLNKEKLFNFVESKILERNLEEITADMSLIKQLLSKTETNMLFLTEKMLALRTDVYDVFAKNKV